MHAHHKSHEKGPTLRLKTHNQPHISLETLQIKEMKALNTRYMHNTYK